ncbi:uncharacterized protein DC041_0000735 [Schistosoma bovis]|uniref:Oxalate:formate antiporter n=1 Tax=Schistosoma bovis TaxID=6184 RepID=A0A430QMW6_SCHBO|nr:uncharacterized protein DC041_0000735 [Schistosoma bovis]
MRVVSTVVFVSTPYKHGTQMSKDSLQHDHSFFPQLSPIANMVPYILSYIKARVDPSVQSQSTVWLSALALASQGLSMALGGLVYQKAGFRVVVGIGCLLHRTYIGVIITYSVLMGLGLGFAYSVVMGVAAKWFPKRRFLIVGLVVGGFGLGALVFTPIQTALINPNNTPVNPETKLFDDPELLDRIPRAFLILGGILISGQIVGFVLMSEKKQKLFGQEFISDDKYLSIVASITALFNAGGRIMWGAIVDRISFKTVGSILCSVVSMFIHASDPYLVQFSGCGGVCLLAFVFAIWIEDKKIIPKVDCIPCVKMCPSLRVRKNSENQEDNA